MLAGYLGSLNDVLKNSGEKKQRSRKKEDSDDEEEKSGDILEENSDNVVVFTQKLVAGELTEQLMRSLA